MTSRDLQAEGVAVARAHGGGALLGEGDAWQRARLADMEKLPRGATASMQRDMVAGRVSELHEQLGAMCRLAEAKAVPAPMTSFVYAALLPQESEARGGAAPAPKADKDEAIE